MRERALPESFELNPQPETLPVGWRRPGQRCFFKDKRCEKMLFWKALVGQRDQWWTINTPVAIPLELMVVGIFR